MSAKRAKPTSYLQAGDKAGKLSSAIQQVFQEHKAKLGSKTLMSIAFSTVSKSL